MDTQLHCAILFDIPPFFLFSYEIWLLFPGFSCPDYKFYSQLPSPALSEHILFLSIRISLSIPIRTLIFSETVFVLALLHDIKTTAAIPTDLAVLASSRTLHCISAAQLYNCYHTDETQGRNLGKPTEYIFLPMSIVLRIIKRPMYQLFQPNREQ